jgi:hypothetical protein
MKRIADALTGLADRLSLVVGETVWPSPPVLREVLQREVGSLRLAIAELGKPENCPRCGLKGKTLRPAVYACRDPVCGGLVWGWGIPHDALRDRKAAALERQKQRELFDANAPLGRNGDIACDVTSGPCACGAWH